MLSLFRADYVRLFIAAFAATAALLVVTNPGLAG